MSDIHLLTIIILRLEEARFTRQAEIRLISQHIRRFEEIRTQRANQVRQRLIRATTYRENQSNAVNGLAPVIPPQEQRVQEDNTLSEEDIPELEPVEDVEDVSAPAGEEREYLDIQQA